MQCRSEPFNCTPKPWQQANNIHMCTTLHFTTLITWCAWNSVDNTILLSHLYYHKGFVKFSKFNLVWKYLAIPNDQNSFHTGFQSKIHIKMVRRFCQTTPKPNTSLLDHSFKNWSAQVDCVSGGIHCYEQLIGATFLFVCVF